MKTLLSLLLVLGFAGSAMAQQPQPTVDFQAAMHSAFNIGFATGQEVFAELKRLNERIKELESKCGDKCKPQEQK